MTDEDRFKELEKKFEKLRLDNDRLEAALGHLTEAFMILIEEEDAMTDEAPDIFDSNYLANT